MKALLRRLRRDRRGLALIEFGYFVPILLAFGVTGVELANYITVRLRVSQLALHIADNAGRLGEGTVLVARRLTERDINDLLTGAGLQAGNLDLYTRGRVILSDLEPMPAPNNPRRYQIRWQRCRGALTSHASTYGAAGAQNLTGIGPAGRQAIAMDNNATMFVEVYYEYEPLVLKGFSRESIEITEIASMAVRERRDLTGGNNGVFPVAGVTPSTCTAPVPAPTPTT